MTVLCACRVGTPHSGLLIYCEWFAYVYSPPSLAMSVLLSCLLSVASSHPVVLRTRLGRGLCRSVTLRAVSCCAQHTSLAEQRCTPGTSRKARTLN